MGRASEPDTTATVLIVGGGRFGRIAARRLGRRVLRVVEPRPTPELLALGVAVEKAEGVEAARRALAQAHPPRWIVPCLPRHLLGLWLMAELAELAPRIRELTPQDLPQTTSRLPGPDGTWFFSHADFLCPDDCPEPAAACTVTGRPRPADMFQLLAAVRLPGFRTAVVRSRQLAPGVGGLESREMIALRDRLAARGGHWLVGTACRCHGVLQGLALQRGAQEGGDDD